MRTADENKRRQGSEAQDRTEENTGAQNQNVRRVDKAWSKWKRTERSRRGKNKKNKTGRSRAGSSNEGNSFSQVTTHHPQQSTFASPDFSRTLAVRPLKPEAQKRTEAKSGKKRKKRGR